MSCIGIWDWFISFMGRIDEANRQAALGMPGVLSILTLLLPHHPKRIYLDYAYGTDIVFEIVVYSGCHRDATDHDIILIVVNWRRKSLAGDCLVTKANGPFKTHGKELVK